MDLLPMESGEHLEKVDNGFRYCTNGAFSSVKIACAGGTMFNNQIQSCDWARNVNCAQRRLRGGLA